MAVTQYITSQLVKEDEMQRLRAMFSELDVNSDGSLTREELMEGYNRAMGLSLSERELQSLMKVIDVDNSGTISYDEFVTSAVQKSTVLDRENL